MKTWKVILEIDNKKKEFNLEAERYSDIYITVTTENPGCRVLSITELRPKKSVE
jgi:hypothetical protein